MTTETALNIIESLPAPLTQLGIAAQIIAKEYREIANAPR